MNALCQYAKENLFSVEQLEKMCSLPASELDSDLKKGWCKIAECLPNRSVQSIHNFCRRRFNPENYSGKWTPQEVTALKGLVQTLGHQWKMIAKALNDQFFAETRSRTAENVKDKYKQIGGDNCENRIVGEWKLEETLTLIKLIEKAT